MFTMDFRICPEKMAMNLLPLHDIAISNLRCDIARFDVTVDYKNTK